MYEIGFCSNGELLDILRHSPSEEEKDVAEMVLRKRIDNYKKKIDELKTRAKGAR